MVKQACLPRLLYVGDVPVEASYHGSALLYRLLDTYPAERLAIVEAGLVGSKPERRLKGVGYAFAPIPFARLQKTRLSNWFTAAALLLAPGRSRGLHGAAGGFRPDAILTVTHGYAWLTAAKLAHDLGIPLHLICHDEWVGSLPTPRLLHGLKESIFARVYRAASSRICVSPFMAERYSRQYGVPSLVVYPSRASGADQFDAPPARLAETSAALTCAFAGSVNSMDTIADLALLADCLETLGGRLLVYGPFDATQPGADRLRRANVELRGLLPSAELIRELRARADVLFVPIPFAAQHRSNMEIHFPSKLTDYTAVGLPILIYGPDYSSAVKWAKAHDGVAELVTEEGRVALAAALARLRSDAGRRICLADKAIEMGRRYFTHEAAFETFSRALNGDRTASR